MSAFSFSVETKEAEHQVLLHRIPALPDLQSAWALLVHCAALRATISSVLSHQSLERSSPAHMTDPCGHGNMMGAKPLRCHLLLGLGLRSARRTRKLGKSATQESSLTSSHTLEGFQWDRACHQISWCPWVRHSILENFGPQEFVLPLTTLRTTNLAARGRVGNTRLVRERSNKQFWTLDLFPVSQTRKRPCCVLKVVPERMLSLSTTPSNPLTRMARRGFAVESTVACAGKAEGVWPPTG